MINLNLIWITLLFWILFYIIRRYLSNRNSNTKRFLFEQQNGAFYSGWFSLTYETIYWNEFFNTFQSESFFPVWFHKIYCFYFRLSSWFTLIVLPYVLYIFSKPIFYLISQWHLGEQTATHPVSNDFVIILPGISVPLHHSLYFILAIIISSIIHELGHAFAANLYHQKVESLGFSVYFFLPMFFVRFELDAVLDRGNALWKKLQIFTTALLNNAALCLIAFCLLFVNPFSIFYSNVENGIVVSSIANSLSTTSDASGLHVGDVIAKINGKNIHSPSDWFNELESIHRNSNGFCIPEKLLSINDEPPLTASLCKTDWICESSLTESQLPFLVEATSSHTECQFSDQLYRRLLLQSNVRNHFKQLAKTDDIVTGHYQQCLPVRKIVRNAVSICQANSDCFDTFLGPSKCVHPLDFSDPQRKLIVLSRANNRHEYIFWGRSGELAGSLKMSDDHPRLSMIPVWLYDEWQIQLKYIILISLSLLFFNLIPCYPFDGYHIFDILTLLTLHDRVTDVTRLKILKFTNIFSVILIVLCFTTTFFFSSSILNH